MTDWKERAERAEAELARLRAQVPVGWIGPSGFTHNTATNRMWMRESPKLAAKLSPVYAAPPAQPADLIEMSPEFTDTARSALLWVLWHHQGGSSKVGQPIRFALGMGQHEHLSDDQIREAKRWDLLPQTVAAQPAEPVQRLSDALLDLDSVEHMQGGANGRGRLELPTNGLKVPGAGGAV